MIIKDTGLGRKMTADERRRYYACWAWKCENYTSNNDKHPVDNINKIKTQDFFKKV